MPLASAKYRQRHSIKKSAERLLLLPLSSLRGRLLLGAALLWSLLNLILLTFGWQSGRHLVNETNFQHLRYEAELISNTITLQVNEHLDELEHIAQGISTPRAGTLNELLAQNMSPSFDALGVFDLQSRVVDEWPVDAGGKGRVFADREYVRFMHAFQTPHVSEPITGRITGSPVVVMLTPLHDAEGRYTGFLCGVLNIKNSQFFKGFNNLRLGEGGYVTITTAAGQRIYSPSTEQMPNTNSPTLEQALYGWEGESIGRSLSGEPQLVAYRQIWPADWIVGVHLPQRQAEAPLIAGMQRISSYAWGVLLLILPVIWGAIWLILRPLSHLARQVQELQEKRRHLLHIPTRMTELRRIIKVINKTECARQTILSDLAEREALLRGTLAASPQGMFVTNKQGHLTFVNDALYHILGHEMPKSLKAWSKRIHPEDQRGVQEAWSKSLAQQSDFARQFRFEGPHNDMYWLDMHTAFIHINNEFIGTVGTVHDITQHHKNYAQKRWEAEHDPLTNLLNRRGLTRHLEEAFIECKTMGKPTAVLLLDLDNFKPINDQGGHSLGDQMLQKIANILQRQIRNSDQAARHGGDEFSVLLPGCTSASALTIAESLRASIAASSIESQGQQWQVTASIGVTHLKAKDETIDDVLNRADTASYQAKRGGRNRVVCDADDLR